MYVCSYWRQLDGTSGRGKRRRLTRILKFLELRCSVYCYWFCNGFHFCSFLDFSLLVRKLRMHNLANNPPPISDAQLMTSSARRFGKQFSAVYSSNECQGLVFFFSLSLHCKCIYACKYIDICIYLYLYGHYIFMLIMGRNFEAIWRYTFCGLSSNSSNSSNPLCANSACKSIKLKCYSSI